MTFKRVLKSVLAACMAAALAATVCSCDDLGEYEDEEEYYHSFGNVVLIDASEKDESSYSIEDYFYNKESRDDFLVDEDGIYGGVAVKDYVYMAIPVHANMEMDSLALYFCGDDPVAKGDLFSQPEQKSQTLYISLYLTDYVPSKWKAIGDPDTETVEQDGVEVEKEIEYDDPDPATALADVVVHLNGAVWNSFIIDVFETASGALSGIQLTDGQYLLIQFRNNSGVRVLDPGTNQYVDQKTGLALETAHFTMTNLLIRSLGNDTEG